LFNKKGFTLIEIMIALVLSSILATAIYAFFTSQEKIYNIQDQISETQQNLRVGLDKMIKDIRMSGYENYLNPAGAGIAVAAATSIQITADLNGDGDTSDTNENITYSLYDSGGDGDLDLGRNSQPLVENIANNGLQFRYFDENNTELASTPLVSGDRLAVRSIEVILTAQTARRNPDTGRYLTRTLASRVTPRNLAY